MELLFSLQNALWGGGTIALLLGTGVFLTLRTRFFPVRNLGRAIFSALSSRARHTTSGGVSSFSALMTALAATIGEEAVTLEDVCEPYLLQIGFLARTLRGRMVTRLGYEHLGIPYPKKVDEILSTEQISILDEE